MRLCIDYQIIFRFMDSNLPQDFHKFDQNQDHVIDSDEFGAMLDQVMKEEGLKQ